MRISDWSSDVCSSDLDCQEPHRDIGRLEKPFDVDHRREPDAVLPQRMELEHQSLIEKAGVGGESEVGAAGNGINGFAEGAQDRKSVVQGKSVSVRVDIGGRRIIKKKKKKNRT